MEQSVFKGTPIYNFKWNNSTDYPKMFRGFDSSANQWFNIGILIELVAIIIHLGYEAMWTWYVPSSWWCTWLKIQGAWIRFLECFAMISYVSLK